MLPNSLYIIGKNKEFSYFVADHSIHIQNGMVNYSVGNVAGGHIFNCDEILLCGLDYAFCYEYN